MVSKPSKKSNKKPLHTTLGKASTQNEEEIDLSHVQKPIHTSVFGLNQVLSLLQTATNEVRNYIIYECEIMYECRICRTIFRSLANFILHKRSYCQERFFLLNMNKDNEEETSEIVESHTNAKETKGIATVVQKLKEKQEINDLTQKLLIEDLSSKKPEKKINETSSNKNISNDILLERIVTNDAAVFQTVMQAVPEKTIVKEDFMKSEVMEIHGILDSDEAVLGPDGKICNFETNKINENPIIPKYTFFCSECDSRFSTKKTLTYHIKYKHNYTRIVYICPECKDSFANAWCVFRHLLKIHRKTNSQIKRMRQQIHNSAIRISEGPLKKNNRNVVEVENTDEDNQWLTNIEGDNDFQMCGGCGKRFERKAALQSHVQMCTKRIAVCNTIKENNAKRKEEESKDSKAKVNKIDNPCPTRDLKGASKRKPYLLRTYKSFEDAIVETSLSKQTQSTCDVNANNAVIDNDCDNKAIVLPNESDMNVPAISECMSYSSVEDIDTKRMLIITGVHSDDPESNVGSINEHSEIKEEINNDEAINFDMLYQKHSKDLLQSGKNNKINIKDLGMLEKDSKVIPIILGRSEKKEVDVEQLLECHEPCVSAMKSDISCEENCAVLEDVKDISSVSYTIKANISPQALKKRLSKPTKRKRSSSLQQTRKSLKFSESFFGTDDLEFVDKARHYMNLPQLMCIPCKLSYPTMAKLLWHMSAHFSWFRFQCSRCSFISWSKTDCINHANNVHYIKDYSMESVVLPIPSWRIMSMSNEFQELTGDFDLTGRHTDEIILGSDEEAILIQDESENADERIKYPDLFSDSENLEEGCEKPFPQPIVSTPFALKNESIDIVDEYKESFLVEVPSVIIEKPYDIVSIADTEEFDERFRSSSPIIPEKDEIEKDYFIPIPKHEVNKQLDAPVPQLELEANRDVKLDDDRFIIIDMDKMEAEGKTGLSEEESSNRKEKLSDIHTVEKFIKVPETPLHVRPIRNRTRSIKTLQNDFFYDLNKVIKLNESGSNQKQKKSGNTNTQKIPKVSIPSNSKPIRVYLKKK